MVYSVVILTNPLEATEIVDNYGGLFDLILYIPVNNLSVMSGRVFLGLTSTKLGLMCLAQGHNTVTLVKLKPATPRSRVKYSTTEPLCSSIMVVITGVWK